MNKNINWKKYLKTSLYTMVVLTLFSFMFFWYDTVISYDINVKQEPEVPQELVMYKIDELKQGSKYWENPKLCYEIGTLYERIFLFDIATKYYLRSIEIASKNYYAPHFRLAKLNMERGKFDDAIFVMQLVPNINNSSIKYNKGVFWEKLSVQYANKNRIDEALEAIKKAIIYYKSVDNEACKKAKEVQAYLLMKKSEELIAKDELKEAVIILENTQKVNDSAELTYRLAILNYKNNNEKAFKYMEKVQQKNPSIVNYDIYYALLNDLIQESKQNGNASKERFYKQKSEMLRRYVNNNFVSEGDFRLDNVTCTVKKQWWGIKRFIEIKFDIYNNTKNSYRNLYLQTDVMIEKEKVSKITKIKNKNGIILPYTTAKDIKVMIDISEFSRVDNKVSGKIYLYKNPKFNKIDLGKF